MDELDIDYNGDSFQKNVLDLVSDYYLESGDFNGMLPDEVRKSTRVTEARLRSCLSELIRKDLISLNSRSNFHIKMFEDDPVEDQLELLNDVDFTECCLYPTKNYLESIVDRNAYNGRPFTQSLALGEPQLKPHYFDLTVLEPYRNDPRMRYSHNDICGGIWITDEASEEGKADDRDKRFFLQSFGFGFDKDRNRCVAAYTCYLSGLPPEHQRMWEAKILSGDRELHPDYFRSSIQGEFPMRWPLCEAFTAEMRYINEMSNWMGRPRFFLKVYEYDNRPRDFTFLLRPTEKEYYSFVQILDKLISDNINSKFFGKDVEMEEEIQRGEGRFEVRRKGTLRLLEEWLSKRFKIQDDKSILDEMVATFKKVRKLRQKPAHDVLDDIYDPGYFEVQRQLFVEAYTAVRTLRQIFSNHPLAKHVEIEPAIFDGDIWNF